MRGARWQCLPHEEVFTNMTNFQTCGLRTG